MIQKSELRLGLPVTFTKCYSIDPKRRLYPSKGDDAEPEQCCKVFKGVLVGKRNYIMGEIKHTFLGCEEGYITTGKQRPMLLVATSLYKLPVLVKIEDAEITLGCFYCGNELLNSEDKELIFNDEIACEKCYKLLVEVNKHLDNEEV